MNKKKKEHQSKARTDAPRFTFDDIQKITEEESLSYGKAVAKYYPPKGKKDRKVTHEYIR